MSINVSETITQVTVNITEDGTQIQVNPVVYTSSQQDNNINGGTP
jgi:hypothetical protein